MTCEQLRSLFLFEDLTDEQLAWVSEHGDEVEVAAGTEVFREGDPAECFWVLLSGTIAISQRVGGDRVETARTDQVGVYVGAVSFYLRETLENGYVTTARAVTDVRLLALPADKLDRAFREWFPMAVHLLQGMVLGTRRGQAITGQRERLLALGKLSAGLTHELNNPAAAAARATAALRDRVAGMRHKLAMIAEGKLDKEALLTLTALQEDFADRVHDAPELSAVAASDLEDELSDWFDDNSVAGGWDLAPIFVSGGLRVEDLERVRQATQECDTGASLDGAMRWLAYTVETESLLREITDSTSRITALVGAAKQYSQLDRAPYQWFNVHEGLKATLVMFSGKIAEGITVVKDFDRSLPEIPGYPAELNQVWTNLIDNALQAMNGSGTLTVRTARDDESLLVAVSDTGPGIPPDIRKRVFEPFFTTKGVGQGTGLGLDVSWRVVVTRHHGDLRVDSEPGNTRFEVRLPLTETV
ncbi:MAG TPA: ATP-binding protein [Pseudonocardia sp.]|jgi:signal transduction histidine kinase|nr:ATP-binding protein [Pseudonocardia sp.]